MLVIAFLLLLLGPAILTGKLPYSSRGWGVALSAGVFGTCMLAISQVKPTDEILRAYWSAPLFPAGFGGVIALVVLMERESRQLARLKKQQDAAEL